MNAVNSSGSTRLGLAERTEMSSVQAQNTAGAQKLQTRVQGAVMVSGQSGLLGREQHGHGPAARVRTKNRGALQVLLQ